MSAATKALALLLGVVALAACTPKGTLDRSQAETVRVDGRLYEVRVAPAEVEASCDGWSCAARSWSPRSPARKQGLECRQPFINHSKGPSSCWRTIWRQRQPQHSFPGWRLGTGDGALDAVARRACGRPEGSRWDAARSRQRGGGGGRHQVVGVDLRQGHANARGRVPRRHSLPGYPRAVSVERAAS